MRTILSMEVKDVTYQMEHATANLTLMIKTNANLVKMAGSLLTAIVNVSIPYFCYIENI